MRRGPSGGVMLTTRDVAQIRELRYGDGLTAAETAARLGVSSPTVLKYAPGSPGKIENAALREAFLKSGRGAPEVALEIGWTYTKLDGRYLYGDGTRLRRALGLTRSSTARGGRRYRSTLRLIDAEMAARIAEAIGVAPWAVGA